MVESAYICRLLGLPRCADMKWNNYIVFVAKNSSKTIRCIALVLALQHLMPSCICTKAKFVLQWNNVVVSTVAPWSVLSLFDSVQRRRRFLIVNQIYLTLNLFPYFHGKCSNNLKSRVQLTFQRNIRYPTTFLLSCLIVLLSYGIFSHLYSSTVQF